MKRIYLTLITLVVLFTALSLTSCIKSDDNEEIIPAGTYIEENGHESELFSFVASGNTVRWTCTVYGKVDSVILPEMKGIYIKDLLEVRHPTIVFILVDDPYDMEIQEILSINDNLYAMTLRELSQMNYVIKAFYGEAVFEKYKKLPDYSIKET